MAPCDQSFGPRVDSACRSFDFTLLFEDVVLATVPAAALLLLLPAPLYLLLRTGLKVKTSSLGTVKLLALASLFTCQTAFLALRAVNPNLRTAASLAADILGLVATIGASALSRLDHHRSIRPSTLLAAYFSVFSLLSAARLRTLCLIPGAVAAAVVFGLILGLSLLVLWLESLSKSAHLISPEKYAGSSSEPFSGLWKRVAYAWLLLTVRAGYAKILTVDELPDVGPQLRSEGLLSRLEGAWASAGDKSKKNSLLWASLRAYSGAFLAAVVPRLLLSGFTYAQPFMINALTSWISDKGAPSNLGEGLIGAYALVYLGMAVATALYWYQLFRFLISLRGGLVAIVYKQTIRTRTVDMGEITGLTLMGIDIDRILVGFRSIHEVWASLLDMGVALYLLERQLGPACLVPGLLVLAFSFANFKLATLANKAQKAWIEKVERRLAITTSMLKNMRAVKLLALDVKISKILDGLQRIEVVTSRHFRKNLILQIFLSNSPSFLAPVATFAIYVALAHVRQEPSILASRAFTSLALITLLTTSALTFIQAIPATIQCFSCFDRIQEYCTLPAELLTSTPDSALATKHSIHRDVGIKMKTLTASDDNTRSSLATNAVVFAQQDFSWTQTGPSTLRSISLNIRAGRVTLLLGATASGKSTLLQSILGETFELPGGRVERNFAHAAYCSQVPWLKAGTIRENIVGPNLYVVDWYSSVVEACGLQKDFTYLESGDQAQVGSNGDNLSGGQRQRVALARAIYSKSNLVVLDDVLSGVDAHTAKHIVLGLFGTKGLLRHENVTVVIATSSRTSLLTSIADDVLVLDGGRLAQAGSVDTVVGQIPSEQHELQKTETESQSHQHAAAGKPDEAGSHDMFAEQTIDLRRQQGDWSVYSYYARAAGWYHTLFFLMGMALGTTCLNYSTIWLKQWSDASVTGNADNGFYLGVYAALGISSTLLTMWSCWELFVNMITRSLRTMHQSLLSTVFRAPLAFFQLTDIGSITNRFSQDMELVGLDFPLVAINYVSAALNCLAQILILAIYAKFLALTGPFVVILIFILQKFYLRTSRQIRLLDIEAKAPLFSQFIETTSGSATIRAFGWQQHFQQRLASLLDRSQRPVYLLYCVQQWLALILDLIVSALAIILVAIVVNWRSSFDPGSVGVALVMVMTFNKTLMSVVKYWTMLETSVGAVSRIKRFEEETEHEEGPSPDESPRLIDWPVGGAVTFSNVQASYRPDSAPVLRNINIAIPAGAKVAICGRSGSGKTSFILSLLQMISVRQGTITIDGLDLATINRVELRDKINVVTQEPLLMPGTVRFNIDPYGTASEDSITRVLGLLKLWARVSDVGGLDSELDPDAWSVGEKQLLCFARALCRGGKLVILDEAMSSVDQETAAFMQGVIGNEWKSCTVLSVMHRLDNISNFDGVVLMDHGEVAEYGDPTALLANENSALSKLYRAGGYGARTSTSDESS